MKTINFELSKKLYEKWLLKFKQYEYSRFFRVDDEWNSLAVCKNSYNEFLEEYKEYPTMALEEAIKFLPREILWWELQMNKTCIWYEWAKTIWLLKFCWKTLLEAIEKMLEYLLDNNLLTTLKTNDI